MWSWCDVRMEMSELMENLCEVGMEMKELINVRLEWS